MTLLHPFIHWFVTDATNHLWFSICTVSHSRRISAHRTGTICHQISLRHCNKEYLVIKPRLKINYNKFIFIGVYCIYYYKLCFKTFKRMNDRADLLMFVIHILLILCGRMAIGFVFNMWLITIL